MLAAIKLSEQCQIFVLSTWMQNEASCHDRPLPVINFQHITPAKKSPGHESEEKHKQSTRNFLIASPRYNYLTVNTGMEPDWLRGPPI